MKHIKPMPFYIVFCLILSTEAIAAKKSDIKNLKLLSTNWCPYVCDSIDKPGIVVEYLTKIFGKLSVKSEIELLPWKRAVKLVHAGKADALLTATPSEAPNLKFTKTPTMNYRTCFFGLKKNMWKYKDSRSLQNIKIGYISGYGYGEPLDSYFSKKSKNIFPVHGTDALNRLRKMISVGRIDAIVEDENVLNHSMPLSNLKKLDCLKPSQFYIAFSPKTKGLDKLLIGLNKALKQPKNLDLLKKIKSKYQYSK